MTSEKSKTPAEILYSEGMKYDLNQDKSLAAATVARVAFQQAALMGHTPSIRALAHMVFDGRGGAPDKESALLWLWSVFNQGDHEALEELEDMMESYVETIKEDCKKNKAEHAASQVAQLHNQIQLIGSFMHELANERANRS